MARIKKRTQYLMAEPNWGKLSLIEKDDERYKAHQDTQYWIHQEIATRETYKHFREWVKKHSGWDKKTQTSVLGCPDWRFLTLGEYAFFQNKVGWMPQKVRDFIDDKLPLMIEKGDEAIAEKKAAKKVVKLKPKPVREELPMFLDAIEKSVESLGDGKKGAGVETLLSSLPLNKEEASEAFDTISSILDEFSELVRVRKIKDRSDWDEQLVEGYSHISRPNTKKIVDYLTDATIRLVDVKEKKVVRRKKPQDPRKIVARLRYLQADKDLSIASINPIDILGCSEVWVYDTKRRRLGLYASKNPGGLGVKGTSITGYDTDMSYEKTLRKHTEQLPLIVKKSKNALHDAVGKIRGKKMKVKTRINPNMLILKVQ